VWEAGIGGETKGKIARWQALFRGLNRRRDLIESHHLPVSQVNFKGVGEKVGFKLQAKWLIKRFAL
jgi:hypothetical protein